MKKTVSRRQLVTSTAIGTIVAPTMLSPSVLAADQLGTRSNNLSTVRTLSEPGRWDEYSRERDLAADVVQAVEFTLDQAAAGGGVDLVVICDVLAIDGQVKLPSKNITLVARKIICRNSPALDTSGQDTPADPKRASDGRTPGAIGSNGAAGAKGADGGAILIAAGSIDGQLSLRANGGAGAKGQQGGQGAVGPTGPVGSHATSRNRPGDGGMGGTGGKGGTGGNGGDGGAGGQITVVTLGSLTSNLGREATGGLGGSVGDPGPGGPGGAGGAPGDPTFVNPPRHGPDGDSGGETAWWDPGANPGPAGKQGEIGNLNTSIANPGASPSPAVTVGTVDEIATWIPVTQLGMTLSHAYLAFANRNGDDLVERLDWVRQIALSTNSGSKFFEERAARSGSTQVGAPSRAELDALGGQAAVLLSRLRLGLDVFGHPLNYVSSLNPEYLEAAASKRFEIAKSIEAAHNKYLTEMTDLRAATSSLKEALGLVQQSRDQLAKDQAQYDLQANQTQDDISALSLTISELTQKLQAADYKFMDAVSGKAGGGCTIIKMIEFVVGVIAICYGFYAGVMAISDSMKTANSAGDGGGIIKDLEFIVETFEKSKVADYFRKMQEGFQKVQDALKNDSTKLVVSLEAFESQLQPYLDMDEAKNYRDLMRQLVDVAKARNDKLLAYTQFVLKSTETQLHNSSLGLEADRISGLLAQTNNPVLVDCVVFLARFLASTKRGLVELLDLQRRSLVYTSLVYIQPLYKWTVVAELQQSKAANDQLQIEAADRRGRANQKLSANFSINRSTNRSFFDLLQRNGKAVFSIPMSHPEFNRGGTAFVTVYEVAFVADGIESKTGEFTLRLTHQGNSIIRDQGGNLMNFCHRTRPTTLSYRRKEKGWEEIVAIENNLGGSEDKYLYLSPFAGWTLQVVGNDKVDWAKVKVVNFHFKALFIPSDTVIDFGTKFIEPRIQQ